MANGFQRPPDPEQILRELTARIQKVFNKFSLKASWVIGLVAIIWGASGTVIVQPEEEAVMLRFGKVVSKAEPGLNWNWPWPAGRTFKVPVTRVQKIEVGFRTVQVGPPARYQRVQSEALMLTGDENIVSLEFIVQYKIKDSMKYLFEVRDPIETLKDASEAAMREVVGKSKIDSALTEGKGAIQTEAQDIVQSFMDQYESGIQILTVKLQDVNPPDQVNDAFKDVINAQQDKERKINEAKGFENDLIPAARGEAAQQINQAEAYKQSRITEAEGEADRFRALLREYQSGKNVTKARLYLETMEEILPGTEKMVIDNSVKKSMVPYLPLNRLGSGQKPSGGTK